MVVVQHYRVMPIMYFGFWQETLEKWGKEDHLAQEKIAPILNRRIADEYGAWEYDIETMRKKFGKERCGVGNIKKNASDAE